MPGLPLSRQPIKNALFNLVSNVVFDSPINNKNGWVLTGRRLKLWSQVDVSEQPAMFMVQHRETYTTHGEGRLTRRYLDMGLWCYAPTGDESIVGDDLLDLMELALETALVPDDPGRDELTLGGLCHWCRITRENELFIRDPGDLDGQAMLILPVRILLP